MSVTSDVSQVEMWPNSANAAALFAHHAATASFRLAEFITLEGQLPAPSSDPAQAEHDELPGAAKDSARQMVVHGIFLLRAKEYVPAAQSRHTSLPGKSWNLPGTHAAQLADPARAKVPIGHLSLHDKTRPVTEEKRPAIQLVHDD